jgi:hypothetical protein
MTAAFEDCRTPTPQTQGRDMTLINSTAPVRWRRLLPVAFIAAAGALGGSALAEPAHACAAPREWDIGAYDQCLNDGLGKGYNEEEWLNHQALCCWATGGDWNAAQGKCQAPPAEPAQRPGMAPRPGVIQTLEPAAPPVIRNPGVVTETFSPAPANLG